jgi:putative transposase
MVLHTWGQNLSQHLHVHCVVSGGTLGPEGQWIPAKRGFLFPVRALSVVFRGKYLEALRQAFEAGQLAFSGETIPLGEPSAFGTFFAKLRAKDWVVYARPPFGGPGQVLAYLGRYTHRIAIGNDRLPGCENGQVRFRYRDYAHRNKTKVMRLPAEEFIRRSLLHVPPGLHADPALWPTRQSPSYRAPRRLPGRPRCAYSGACRTRNRRGLPLSGARDRSQPLPALWPRTAASHQSTPTSPSGHRPAAPAMGGLNRTGSSPAFYEVQDEPLRFPLRRRLRTPPQAALRPRPPLTLPGAGPYPYFPPSPTAGSTTGNLAMIDAPSPPQPLRTPLHFYPDSLLIN